MSTNRFECFACGNLFTVGEANAAQVPEHFNKTYCTKLCYEIDTEEIEKQIKQEQLMQEEALLDMQKEVSSSTQTLKVGQFSLKVTKP